MMAVLPLFAALAIVAGLAALARPMIAVCAFIALTLINAPGILVNEHGLPSIGTLFVPGLIGLLLLRTLMGDTLSRAMGILAIPALVYFTLTALRVPWTADTELAFAQVSELGKNLVIMLVLVGFITTPERLRLAVRTAALSIGGLAALSVFQYLTGRFDSNFYGFANASIQHISGNLHGWRLSGPLPDPNFYAQLLVMALPLSLGLALTDRNRTLRSLTALSTILIVAAILLTYSRGALVSLVLLALAYVTLYSRRSILLAALIFSALAIIMLPSDISERVYSGLQTGRLLFGQGDISGDPAVIQRISVMRAAMLIFIDHPFLGIGPGQFSIAYPSYALAHDLDIGAPPAPHSLYLEIAAEQGLTGLVLFAVLIGAAFKLGLSPARTFKVVRPSWQISLAQALAFAILAYLVTAIFLHDAFPRLVWTFMSLLFASWGANNNSPQKSAPKQWSLTMLHDMSLTMIAVTALRRNLFLILLGSVALGGLAAIQIARTPNLFTAEATLLYRFGREYTPVTPAEVRRNWGENIIISLDNALATELHLLASYEVAAATVAIVNDAVDPGQEADEEQTQGDRTLAFMEQLDLRRVQGATLIAVQIKTKDPVRAEPLLDAFLEAYRQRRDVLFHADAEAYFETRQVALSSEEVLLRDNLARRLAEVRSLEVRNGVTTWSPEDPVSALELENSDGIDAKIAILETAIGDIEARIETVGARLFDLDVERDDWQRSRAFTDIVAPNIEVADRRPVVRDSAGSAATVQILSAALAGAIVFWLGFVVSAFLRPATPPKPAPYSNPAAYAKASPARKR